MKTKYLIAMGCALALFCAPIWAGAQVNQGQKEVSLFGNWNSMEDADFDVVILGGRFGYFLTDPVAVGVSGLYMGTTGDADFNAYGAVVDGRYHFLTETTLVPYVGAEAGLLYAESGSDDDTAFQVGIGGGVKFFFREDASVFAEYKHYLLFNEDDDTSMDQINFGLSVLF